MKRVFSSGLSKFDLMDVDCGRLEEFFSPEMVLRINRIVTEPESYEAEGYIGSLTTSNSVDVGRPEDHHEKNSFGIVESLSEIILPRECEENSDVIWLSSRIIYELASSQAFYEGNKRTAYLSGMLFLARVQKDSGRDVAVIPVLNQDFVELLQDAAVEDISRDAIYRYIEDGIGDEIDSKKGG